MTVEKALFQILFKGRLYLLEFQYLSVNSGMILRIQTVADN